MKDRNQKINSRLEAPVHSVLSIILSRYLPEESLLTPLFFARCHKTPIFIDDYDDENMCRFMKEIGRKKRTIL